MGADTAVLDDRPIREARQDIEKTNARALPASRARHDPATIERCLLELATMGGRRKETVQRLETAGIAVGVDALLYWQRVSHADRYAELAATVAKDLEKKIAAEAEAYIMRAAEVELRLLNRLADRVDNEQADVVQLSNALRNVSVSKGIAMDKVASPIRGRPTVIQGSPDNFDQLLSRLERLGVQFQAPPEVVDAVEVHELPPGGESPADSSSS